MKRTAQLLYRYDRIGDSLLELKDEKILFYYFSEKYNIYFYNLKTFQYLTELYIDKLIYEFEKNNIHKFEYENKDNFVSYKCVRGKYQNEVKNKNCIKELNNGLILIGRNNYLIEINFHDKTYEYKLIKKLEKTILDINELPNEKILVFTNIYILILKKENEEYKILNEYPVQSFWKIKSPKAYYRDFNQYFSSELLPNNKLLLYSHSIEIEYHDTGCIRGPPTKFFNSKFIFIDTNDFTEINSTKKFDEEAKHLILENYIVIQVKDKTFIYDINSFNLIKDIEFPDKFNIIHGFENKYIIGNYKYENYGTFSVFKVENNKFVEHCKIEEDSIFPLLFQKNPFKIIFYNFLFTLRDKRIILCSNFYMFIFRLPLDK